MLSQRSSIFTYRKLLLGKLSDRMCYAMLLAVTIGVLVFDLVSPLGVAAGVLYVLVVFGSVCIKGNTATYVAATMGLLFTVVGFLLSASSISPIETVIINRILAALLIVCAALIVIRIKKVDASILALEFQSVIDPLTQIRNGRAFTQELCSEILRNKRYNRNLSVAMIDIDYLGRINKVYGRDHADDIIKKIAKEIAVNIRNCDVLYRLEGGKFAVLFAETGIRETKRVAEAICKKVSDNIVLSDRKVTLSVGISALEANDNEKLLCLRAEEALQQSKTDEKSRVATKPSLIPSVVPHVAAILTRSRF